MTILPGGPGNVTLQKVVTGGADFGLQRSDDIMVAVTRGVPVVNICGYMQHDPQAILVHEASAVNSFADLDGRTIMAVPGSNWIAFLERRFGIQLDVQPASFGLAQFLADSAAIQQCFVTNEPYVVRREGGHPRTLLISDSGFDPYRVVFATRELVERRPEVVRAFVAASVRGWRDYLGGDPAPADALLAARNERMTPEFLAFSREAMRRHQLVAGNESAGERVGQLSRARLEQQINILRELELLDRPVAVEEIAALDLLPEEVQ